MSEIRIVLTLDGKQYAAELQKAEQTTKNFGATTTGTGTQASVLAARLASVGVAVGSAYVAAMLKGTAIAGEHQRQLLRLEAQITATGGAAGKMAEDLDKASQLLSRNTLFSDESIREAQGRLLTFTSITGANFDRALDLAADLAAVMGTDIPSAAVQLGKALEDPADGLGALSKAGIKFSEDEEKVIKALERTGQHGAALAAVLDAVESKVGGVAQREAEGYAGAMHRVGESWEDFLETLEQTDTMQYWLNAFDALLQKSRQLIAPTEAEQAGELFKERFSLEQQNRRFGPTHPNTIANIPRIAEIDAELDLMRAARNARLGPSGTGSAAPVSDRPGAGKPAASAALTNARAGGELREQEQLLLVEQRRSAEADDLIQSEMDRLALMQEEQRLGRSLTQSEQALFDLRNGGYGDLLPAQREQLRLTLEQSAAIERQALVVDELGIEFQRAGGFAEGMTKGLDDYLTYATDRFRQGAELMDSSFEAMEDTLAEFFRTGKLNMASFADAIIYQLSRVVAQQLIANAVLGITGLYSGSSGGSTNAGAGFVIPEGTISAGITHTGGVIGSASVPTRNVPMSLFGGAPRFHGGGMLGAGEVPIIAKRGEGVFTPEQMKAMGGASNVQVIVMKAPSAAQEGTVERSRGGDGRETVKVMVAEVVASDIRSGGPVASAISSVFGTRRQGRGN